LTLCFAPEKSPREILQIARENFKRIGENYLSAVKTAGMTFDQLKPHLEFRGFGDLQQKTDRPPVDNILMVISHLGNFELYARIQEILPHYQGATTYRGLKQPAMNRLLQSLRGRNGCRFFERRSEGRQLRDLMSHGGVLLGLLADQSSAGLRAPFLGHDCNTGLAPAVLALRYDCALYSVMCSRVALAKWRLQLGEQIPTHEAGHARTSAAIMGDVNRALERAVRADPANWFWVHRRWKS
jgi:KDO2-lipid IV(A) lauroyltransferase